MGNRAEEVEEEEIPFYKLCPSFSQLLEKKNILIQKWFMTCGVKPNDGLALISLSILIIKIMFANQL